MEQIKNRLEKQGIKPTYQRLRILEFLMLAENHPNAETIYENIVKIIPTISCTTVYNTLNLFVENTLIHGITITGVEIRYGIGKADHHHFLCKKCGKIYDIEVHCPFVDGVTSEINGHQIQEIHGYFKGICKDCLQS
ncbi:MAG: hypothetical protein COT43_08980 [Candidatus Marinimicrobia bacterium CG08_land_8_20_14_0_20_45_22]|nr:MAG: hypothetical protein COT43_08980 [Candidatus Marinimicrobia bacterium CG08_land_8_20_14_0_20_45_22]